MHGIPLSDTADGGDAVPVRTQPAERLPPGGIGCPHAGSTPVTVLPDTVEVPIPHTE